MAKNLLKAVVSYLAVYPRSILATIDVVIFQEHMVNDFSASLKKCVENKSSWVHSIGGAAKGLLSKFIPGNAVYCIATRIDFPYLSLPSDWKIIQWLLTRFLLVSIKVEHHFHWQDCSGYHLTDTCKCERSHLIGNTILSAVKICYWSCGSIAICDAYWVRVTFPYKRGVACSRQLHLRSM